MSRTRLARLAAVALVGLTSGCGLFDRNPCDPCRSNRPGLFSRMRGQSPEYVMPGPEMCNGCGEGGTLTSGPFLGTPSTPIPMNGNVLPGPRPTIPPADVLENPARPMPYDPNKMSRPGNSKPSGAEVRNTREG